VLDEAVEEGLKVAALELNYSLLLILGEVIEY
jgi:hypothetical protein